MENLEKIMSMTQEEILALMGDESSEEILANRDKLSDEEEEEYNFDGAYLKRFSKLFGISILLPLVGNRREEYFLDNAELDTSVWFGENLSDNLSEYKKMTTKYLKHFEIECDGSITPLVIHYQSNFPSPRFDNTKLDFLFREAFQIIRFEFQNLVIASKIKEGYDASIHLSEPLLCRTFDFLSVNDTRGQILIGIPYEGFSKWKETQYLSQDEIDEMLA